MNKGIIVSAITVLDNLPCGGAIFYRADGISLVGGSRWLEVSKYLSAKNHGALLIDAAGNISVRNADKLKVLRDECARELSGIEADEDRQALADKALRNQIRTNNHATIVAYVGLAIALISLLNQWFHWFGN